MPTRAYAQSDVSLRILGARDRLLASSVAGGARDSLDNINTAILPDGALCWVVAEKEFWVLDKDATTTSIQPLVVDNFNIVRPAAQQPAQYTNPTIPNPGLWFRLCFICDQDEPSIYAAFQSVFEDSTPGVDIVGTNVPSPITLPMGSVFAEEPNSKNLAKLSNSSTGQVMLDAAVPPLTRVRILVRASFSGLTAGPWHLGLSIALGPVFQPLSEQFVTLPPLNQQVADIVHVTAELISIVPGGATVQPLLRIFGASPTAPTPLRVHSISIGVK